MVSENRKIHLQGLGDSGKEFIRSDGSWDTPIGRGHFVSERRIRVIRS